MTRLGLVHASEPNDAEREADRYSVELMVKAGKDPASLVSFLETMRAKESSKGGSDILSTHPATADRIEAVRAYAEELSRKP